MELATFATSATIRCVDEPAAFATSLLVDRPRIALAAVPPATDDALAVLLRERRRRPGLRIVAVMPPEAIDGRLSAIANGFDDALPSSIAPAELAGRLLLLAEQARRRNAGVGTLPVAAGVELDLVAHGLWREGRLVRLRPKEFRLLAVLAGHPFRAYTRRELLDRVWGPRHAGDPRTVDVHVRWLRAKIEADPDAPLHLITVRGTGYRLDPPEA